MLNGRTFMGVMCSLGSHIMVSWKYSFTSPDRLTKSLSRRERIHIGERVGMKMAFFSVHHFLSKCVASKNSIFNVLVKKYIYPALCDFPSQRFENNFEKNIP